MRRALRISFCFTDKQWRRIKPHCIFQLTIMILTNHELNIREQRFEQRAQSGQSINQEFDLMPKDEQLQLVRDVRAKRNAEPDSLPDLTISGGSGRQSDGWHLHSRLNNSEDSRAFESGLINAIEAAKLKEAEGCQISQHGDNDISPARWFACSATSLHMAMLHHGVAGTERSEQQRQQLIRALHVSSFDGFHGGTQAMAEYARRYGLKAEAHVCRGNTQQELRELDATLNSRQGAITNGGVLRPDGSTLKHYVYVSARVGNRYIVCDPENDRPVLWSREQMQNFLQRGSHGFVAVSR